MSKSSTGVCRDFNQNGKCQRKNCKYEHVSKKGGQSIEWVKARLCTTYLAAGNCKRGDKCTFSHGELKNTLCTQFSRSGECTRGDICAFSHGKQESPKKKKHPKDICFKFLDGKCKNGSKCEFSHDRGAVHASAATFISEKASQAQNANAVKASVQPQQPREKCLKFLLHKSCRLGDACPLAHTTEEEEPSVLPSQVQFQAPVHVSDFKEETLPDMGNLATVNTSNSSGNGISSLPGGMATDSADDGLLDLGQFGFAGKPREACSQFSWLGHCSQGDLCPYSHDSNKGSSELDSLDFLGKKGSDSPTFNTGLQSFYISQPLVDDSLKGPGLIDRSMTPNGNAVAVDMGDEDGFSPLVTAMNAIKSIDDDSTSDPLALVTPELLAPAPSEHGLLSQLDPEVAPRDSKQRELCIDMMVQGKCQFGDQCVFSHDTSSAPQLNGPTVLAQDISSVPVTSVEVAPAVLTGGLGQANNFGFGIQTAMSSLLENAREKPFETSSEAEQRARDPGYFLLVDCAKALQQNNIRRAQQFSDRALARVQSWRSQEAAMVCASKLGDDKQCREWAKSVVESSNVRPSSLIFAQFMLGRATEHLSGTIPHYSAQAEESLTLFLTLVDAFEGEEEKDFVNMYDNTNFNGLAEFGYAKTKVKDPIIRQEAFILRAKARKRLGKVDEAQRDFEAALALRSDLQTQMAHASFLFQLHESVFPPKWHLAFARVKSIWEMDHKNAVPYIKQLAGVPQGVSFQSELMQWLKSQCGKVGKKSGHVKVFLLLTRGKLLIEQNKLNVAMEVLSEACKIDSGSEEAQFTRARLLYLQRNLEEAEVGLDKAEQIWANSQKRGGNESMRKGTHVALREAIRKAHFEDAEGRLAADLSEKRAQEKAEAEEKAEERARLEAEEEARKEEIAKAARKHRQELLRLQKEEEKRVELERRLVEAKALEEAALKAREAKQHEENARIEVARKAQVAKAAAAQGELGKYEEDVNALMTRALALEKELEAVCPDTDEYSVNSESPFSLTVLLERLKVAVYSVTSENPIDSAEIARYTIELQLYQAAIEHDMKEARALMDEQFAKETMMPLAMPFQPRKCPNKTCRRLARPDLPCIVHMLDAALCAPGSSLLGWCTHSADVRFCSYECCVDFALPTVGAAEFACMQRMDDFFVDLRKGVDKKVAAYQLDARVLKEHREAALAAGVTDPEEVNRVHASEECKMEARKEQIQKHQQVLLQMSDEFYATYQNLMISQAYAACNDAIKSAMKHDPQRVFTEVDEGAPHPSVLDGKFQWASKVDSEFEMHILSKLRAEEVKIKYASAYMDCIAGLVGTLAGSIQRLKQLASGDEELLRELLCIKVGTMTPKFTDGQGRLELFAKLYAKEGERRAKAMSALTDKRERLWKEYADDRLKEARAKLTDKFHKLKVPQYKLEKLRQQNEGEYLVMVNNINTLEKLPGVLRAKLKYFAEVRRKGFDHGVGDDVLALVHGKSKKKKAKKKGKQTPTTN